MADTLIPRRDLDFLLHDWLALGAREDRDIVDAFLELSGQLANDVFLPCYKQADVDEPELVDGDVHILPAICKGLAQYAGLGFFSAGFSEELGGLGMSTLACSASFAQFAAANLAMAAYPMLTVANARLIATFGNDRQIDTFARPQIAGEWFGTMCLSEPQAGSSLGDVRTRAEADGSDEYGERYRLSGNKMWISGGDQNASANIVHLVLAKIPQDNGQLPEGSSGLSLFIVPKILPDGARNDIAVAGLNHKMGYRGTANCLLNFGESKGAIGWRVGEPGQGLRQMFMMMNEARINVGLGGAAVAYRAYRLAAIYAQERAQGRLVGARGGSPVPIIGHADVKLMLLAQKAYAEGALALCLYCADLVDREEEAGNADLLGLLTPVAKTWPAEYGLAANDLAIQVHGGYGYTRDFHVEQLYRDNRLNPIHEGTTGIQAQDLLGRKILREGRAMPILAARLAETAGRAEGIADLAPLAAQLRDARKEIEASVALLASIEPLAATQNATLFLRAFGHVVLAWLWLDQAITAYDADIEADLAEGKRRACHYFYAYELPMVAAWLGPVNAGCTIASEAPASIF